MENKWQLPSDCACVPAAILMDLSFLARILPCTEILNKLQMEHESYRTTENNRFLIYSLFSPEIHKNVKKIQ